MKIDIVALVGPLCITDEDGELVHGKIEDRLRQPSGEPIELEFHGVRVLASPFLNAAIGSLVRDYAAEELNRRLRFLNLSADNISLVRRVIANAREYFNNPAVKKVVDNIPPKRASSEPA